MNRFNIGLKIVAENAMIVMLLLVSACSGGDKDDLAGLDLPDTVDYNFHVKPILSDSCFLCHGPDTSNAKAGLSLHTLKAAMLKKLESGLHAIEPGKPNKSEAYLRLSSDDPSYKMPPVESGLKLSDRDKAIVKKWIEQGAEYKPHWAFIKPEKAAVKKIKSDQWSLNIIDHFIYNNIIAEGLTPAPLADKETLIRRVSFDLTGLPPTLEDIDAFLQDESEFAYDKLITRLLDSKAYGERMAVEWLDVARYADTFGYSVDRYRDVSPYRDWVIQSFNDNRPFDEFITWQIAGDLLPNASQEQRLATAFNRIHSQNGEGGIINEEFRVEYVKDRVQTIGTGLLGLTMHCAQCHDHKYDEVSIKEYYAIYAMFNSIDESGQISWDSKDIPVPTMLMPTDDESQKLAALDRQIDKQKALISALKNNVESEFETWKHSYNPNTLTKAINSELASYYPLSKQDNKANIHNVLNKQATGRVLFGSDAKKTDGPDIEHVAAKNRQAIKLNGDDPLYFPDLNGFERAKPFTFAIDALLPEEYKEGVLFHYNKGSILYNFKGFEVSLQNGHWLVRLAHTYPYNAIEMVSKMPAEKGRWLRIALSYDGSSQASGVHFYINGRQQQFNVTRDNLYKDFKHTDKNILKSIAIKVGGRWRGRGAPNTLVDNVKMWRTHLSALELMHLTRRKFLTGVQPLTSEQPLTDKQPSSSDHDVLLRDHFDLRIYKKIKRENEKLTELRVKRNLITENIFEMMVMDELTEPRQSYVLERGSYANHGEPVIPGVPEAILAFDPSWPRNRIGLARWLTDANHPLTARVLVNRYWQLLLGNGIVRTPEDFGNQGQLPSHPELLDWLSREFIDSGWDLKHLIKLIVSSAAYKQSSMASADVLAADPENSLFTRAASARLTAEMLRDNVLLASGLLVKKIGGPSVYPYQPLGLWKMNQAKYKQGAGDDLYRRSMYTIWKRSVPPPAMHTFDSPTRSYSVGVRQNTSTPLQALNLMNDPQYIEAGRFIAQRSMKLDKSLQARLISIFRLLTSKKPDIKELAILTEVYESFIEEFNTSPEKVKELLSVGESIHDTALNEVELAALSSVSNLVMNHDASVIKR